MIAEALDGIALEALFKVLLAFRNDAKQYDRIQLFFSYMQDSEG